MQQVITVEQARKITGCSGPKIPVEYQTACMALAACLTIDEARYWADKAEALAAWAKIYNDNDAGRKARALKLHAFHRMDRLAKELRPPQSRKGRPKDAGGPPGPSSLLLSQGLSEQTVREIRTVGRLTETRLLELANSPSPPAPSTVSRMLRENPEWQGVRDCLSDLLRRIRNNPAPIIARSVSAESAARFRPVLLEILEWLDEFERHLPKEKR